MKKSVNKYTLSMSEIDELRTLILDGNGLTQIIVRNSFCLRSKKAIQRIAEQLKLTEKLRNNNRCYKSSQISKISQYKRNETLQHNLKNLADDIRRCVIERSFTTYDLYKEFGTPLKQIELILKNLGLYERCASNGEEKIRQTARINGRKSADILSGVELKPITHEIINRFTELKTSGLYKTQVYAKMRSEFGFGSKKIKQLCEKFGYPKENPQSGTLNPMYGRSPSKKAGIGIKGWIIVDGCRIFFRSSLELAVYLYLKTNNIKFELSKHRIKYNYNGVQRTYNPDIVIGTTVCEIKPSQMVNLAENLTKYKALVDYCNRFSIGCAIITEETYDLSPYKNLNNVDNGMKDGSIIIDATNLEKLKKYWNYEAN
jgi:hypothetical protein